MIPKYLIYTLVCRDRAYCELLLPLFRSLSLTLDLHTQKERFEIVILADQKCHLYIDTHVELQSIMKPFNWRVVDVTDQDDKQKTTYHKIRLFDYMSNEDLSSYDRIIYIDSDIVIQKNLLHFLDSIDVQDDRLYAYEEGNHKAIHWSLCNYSDEQLEAFDKHGIKAFNSGVFMFKNTPSMCQHFKQLNTFIMDNQDISSFTEQSFINVYFNTRLMSDTTSFEHKIRLFPDLGVKYTWEVFIHYCGFNTSQYIKRNTMNIYIDRYIIENK